MTTLEGGAVTVKLPERHALDWHQRCGEDLGSRVVGSSARSVTLELPPAAVRDLVADARHYVETMFGEWTEGVDYRPAARRCLASLERAGVDVRGRA